MKKLLFILFFGALFLGANAQSLTPNYWNLDGNSNLEDASFLGTTNRMPLIFKTLNTEQMRILPDGNIGIGTDSFACVLMTFCGKFHRNLF
jgi:hypothetical protein